MRHEHEADGGIKIYVGEHGQKPEWIGEFRVDHAASSYGLPVLVGPNGEAYGREDMIQLPGWAQPSDVEGLVEACGLEWREDGHIYDYECVADPDVAPQIL